MFEAVALPTARAARRSERAAAAGDVVVGQHAGPHDVGAGVVIFRILKHTRSRVDKRANQTRRDVVGDGNAPTPENQRSQIWATISVTPAAV